MAPFVLDDFVPPAASRLAKAGRASRCADAPASFGTAWTATGAAWDDPTPVVRS